MPFGKLIIKIINHLFFPSQRHLQIQTRIRKTGTYLLLNLSLLSINLMTYQQKHKKLILILVLSLCFILTPGLSSATHFAWFSHIYFKICIHAHIEQFLSFVTNFPISNQIFEIESENIKKIRFPNEYYIVPLYTPGCYTCIFCVTD